MIHLQDIVNGVARMLRIIKIERKYMILGDSVRREISDALNGFGGKFKETGCLGT